MYTISRYVDGQREYKRIADILTTHVEEGGSYIEFSDGTEWHYPWKHFTLNMILGHAVSTSVSRHQSGVQIFEKETLEGREYGDTLYGLALTFVPHDEDLDTAYDVLKSGYGTKWTQLLEENKQ